MYQGRYMKLAASDIGSLLGLDERFIVIDEAIYDPDFPNDIKLLKSLAPDDIEFQGHIANYSVYPDYAISKLINQGIRLLIRILYPDLADIPVGMIEHIKLRSVLYPGDRMSVFIKKWQQRNRIARFEIGIENQKGTIVYESTVYGTAIRKSAPIKP